MPIGFDPIASYAIVLLALAYFLRPMLYRLIGRKNTAGMACHSSSPTGCQGGCTSCPLGQKATPQKLSLLSRDLESR